jgi:serine/threonine-protein kinase
MLTGDPPHTGNTMQAIVAKVLSATPAPITQVRPLVPPNVDAAVQRALAKTPADRFATAAEFSAALSNPSYTLATAAMASAATKPARSSRRLVAALGVALVAVSALLGWSMLARRTAPPQLLRLPITLPDERPFVLSTYGSMAISPDGNTLIYTGLAGGKQMLIARPLDRLNAEPIAGTEGGSQPFFSPDSKWIGFFASGSLKKVALAGSPPVTLARAGNPRGGAWTDDGHIIFAPASTAGLFRVSEDGGAPPEPLTTVDSVERARGVTSHRWPAALPGGRGVLYTSFSGVLADSRICLQPAGGKSRCLLSGVTPRYAQSGHLFYVSAEGSLVGVNFNLKTLDTTGSPRTLVGGVATDATASTASYVFSDNGTLVYLGGVFVRALARVDRNGTEQVLQDSLIAPASLRFSRDGSRIVMEAQAGGQLRLWLYDIARRVNTPLTFDGFARYPAWHPTANRVIFSRIGGEAVARDIYEIAADGSGVPQLVYSAPADQYEAAWLPDLRHLVVRQVSATGERDIWIVPVTGVAGDSVRPFAVTPSDERAIALSRDGRWLAYVSDEAGQSEVYVRAIPGPGGKTQVSRSGGTEPAWSADGRELFYRDPQNLVSVSVQTTPTFAVLGSRALFRDAGYTHSPDRASYDVHPSGQWFVMSRSLATKAELVLVLNWLSEVQAKLRK